MPLPSRVVGCLLVVLAGCTTTQPFNPTTDALSVADLGIATATFQEMCVETLPDFSQVGATAQWKGFEPLTIRGQEQFGGQTYRTNRKSVVALTLQLDGETPACGVAFLGPDDEARVQQAFVAATSRALGGAPRQRIRASADDAAYHLRNHSAMIFETRAKVDGTSHYVYLTPPSPLGKAEELVAR